MQALELFIKANRLKAIPSVEILEMISDYYFNTAHGLNVNTYLYASGSPVTSDMSIASSSIITDISSGTSFANYTAHCGSTGWSDPAFENADVSYFSRFRITS